MARFESQSQLLLLLLWNLDPFACWQAQVHCSWITKALIQTLFCRLWSEMQLAVGAPELCFLRQKKMKKKLIAFVAQRWNITFQLIWSVWKGKEKRSVPDSGHSLLPRTCLWAHSNIIKAGLRRVSLRYRSSYSSYGFGTSWCGSISDDIRQMKAEAWTPRISAHRSRRTMIKVGPGFLDGLEGNPWEKKRRWSLMNKQLLLISTKLNINRVLKFA